MARLTSTFLLAIALLVGCQGENGAAIERGQLAAAVLQPQDFPQDWIRFDEGPQGQLDRTTGNRADDARFGRLEGWKARYRKPGPAATNGPLVIESRADRFDESGGAEKEIAAIRVAPPLGDLVPDSHQVGEETVLSTILQGTGAAKIRFWFIAWRQANVAASVVVSGFDSKFNFTDAVTLARKQERRIAGLIG